MLIVIQNFYKSAFILGILTLSSFCAYSQVKPERQPQTTIIYCNFDVPDVWRRANTNFYLMYSFKVNDKGEVTDIKKIRDDIVGEENVFPCISDWRMNGFSNSEFIASFSWQHGKGWVEQKIFGKNFKQVMSMEGVGIDKVVIHENTNNSPNLSNR